MMKRLRVLLVDDSELVLHGLRRVLESEGDMEVLGEFTNAKEALSQIKKLSPDVILMDAEMPGVNGLEATRRMKMDGLYINACVIILADRSDLLIESLKVGASGFILKDITSTELIDTIRKVYRNEYPPEEEHGGKCLEEEVELVVNPTADANQLLTFADHVEKGLHASILQTVGSWDWGTAITILVRPDQSSNIMEKLGDMPDVERVEMKPMARDSFPNLLKKFKTMPKSRSNPRERLLVTLK